MVDASEVFSCTSDDHFTQQRRGETCGFWALFAAHAEQPTTDRIPLSSMQRKYPEPQQRRGDPCAWTVAHLQERNGPGYALCVRPWCVFLSVRLGTVFPMFIALSIGSARVAPLSDATEEKVRFNNARDNVYRCS